MRERKRVFRLAELTAEGLRGACGYKLGCAAATVGCS